ncbi:MAG: hypothetical protein ABIH68_05445 [bacterium]
MKKKVKILKAAIIYGGITLCLVGTIVIESVETVKTGYQITELNKKWAEENSRYIELALKYNNLAGIETMEQFVLRNFSLKYPDPDELIFVKTGNNAEK